MGSKILDRSKVLTELRTRIIAKMKELLALPVVPGTCRLLLQSLR